MKIIQITQLKILIQNVNTITIHGNYSKSTLLTILIQNENLTTIYFY
jgi:hypothetical protein